MKLEYNVLRIRKPNHWLDRFFYAQVKSDNPLVTERYLWKVAKKRPAYICSHYPGYLFCQDTFYVGNIGELDRIYQQSGIDAYSNLGFAKVYSDKMVASEIDFLKTKALPNI